MDGIARWTSTALAMALATALAVAPPAAAVDVVEVPGRDADATGASLVGVSASDFAVLQGAGEPRFLVGAAGTQLSERRMDPPTVVLPSVDGVAGFLTPDGVITPPRRLHLLTLATGADTVVDTDDTVLAITGDGWIGRDDDGVIRRHVLGRPGVTSFGTSDEVAADRHGMLVVRQDRDGTGPLTYGLDLVTFATGAVERIVTSSRPISRPALSGRTIAWVTRPPGDGFLVHRRARASGAITDFLETMTATPPQPAVAGDRVGWTFSDSAGGWLRVLDGGTPGRIALPAATADPMAAGDKLIVAVGGRLDRAGVYAVTGSRADRVATLPPERALFGTVTLSAGILRYTDNAIYHPRNLPIWHATVTGTGAPQISPATLLPTRAGRGQAVAFSAARGLVTDPATGQFRLLDRGIPGRSTPMRTLESADISLSGPFAVIDGVVHGPTGAVLARTRDLRAFTGHDLYGSLLAYAAEGDVWVLDVAKARTAANPRRITTGCGNCGRQVSIWGTTVAWSRPDGSFAVGAIGSDTVQEVSGAGELKDLRLGEATLAWRERIGDGETQYVLDLGTPGAAPVALPGYLVDLDDHWFVAGRGPWRAPLVGRLPFHAPYPPRLIATLAATRFSPGGAATWAPQFDTTKPLADVTLQIRAPGGRAIRTLTGTGPDGSIRDLRWDGRSGSGRAAPAGTYTWQLAARAADGEGMLTAANGTRPVTGVLELSRSPSGRTAG